MLDQPLCNCAAAVDAMHQDDDEVTTLFTSFLCIEYSSDPFLAQKLAVSWTS